MFLCGRRSVDFQRERHLNITRNAEAGRITTDFPVYKHRLLGRRKEEERKRTSVTSWGCIYTFALLPGAKTVLHSVATASLAVV